jgi:hypothetical protein
LERDCIRDLAKKSGTLLNPALGPPDPVCEQLLRHSAAFPPVGDPPTSLAVIHDRASSRHPQPS